MQPISISGMISMFFSMCLYAILNEFVAIKVLVRLDFPMVWKIRSNVFVSLRFILRRGCWVVHGAALDILPHSL